MAPLARAEHDKLMKSKRANNKLDTKKLMDAVGGEVVIHPVEEAMRLLMHRMRAGLDRAAAAAAVGGK